MTRWRPSPHLRFKAIGLHWWDGRLLAAEVTDDSGRVKGVRPLGGTVEFGETAEAAVVREFQEELGVDVTVTGSPHFFENMYTHEGALGHEVLAIFDVTMPENALPARTRFEFAEESGQICYADWFDLSSLDGPGQPELYPSGLKTLLTSKPRK